MKNWNWENHCLLIDRKREFLNRKFPTRTHHASFQYVVCSCSGVWTPYYIWCMWSALLYEYFDGLWTWTSIWTLCHNRHIWILNWDLNNFAIIITVIELIFEIPLVLFFAWSCFKWICLIWHSKRFLRLNLFPQCSQVNPFSPVWWNMCERNWVAWMKLLLQNSHLYGRSPEIKTTKNKKQNNQNLVWPSNDSIFVKTHLCVFYCDDSMFPWPKSFFHTATNKQHFRSIWMNGQMLQRQQQITYDLTSIGLFAGMWPSMFTECPIRWKRFVA